LREYRRYLSDLHGPASRTDDMTTLDPFASHAYEAREAAPTAAGRGSGGADRQASYALPEILPLLDNMHGAHYGEPDHSPYVKRLIREAEDAVMAALIARAVAVSNHEKTNVPF